MQDDLELIKGAVISYEDASPKMLKAFWIIALSMCFLC